MSRRNVSRRSFLKSALYTLLGLAGTVTFGGYYGYAREPFNWQSRTIELEWPQLPRELDGLKITHFSDTHFGYHYETHHFVDVLRKIEGDEPDIIVFTGDLFHQNCEDKSQVVELLSKLRAPLGKFAVLGNHDYFFGPSIIRTFLKDSGFELLTNEQRKLERNGASFLLAGIDDQTYGYPDLDKALALHSDNTASWRAQKPSEFTILLSHTPDFADISRQYPIHLQLSGHSHGGQIRFPGFGPLYGPKHGRKYVDGVYTWADSDMKLFTNRGLGTSRVPLRLFCPPEINLLVLRKSNIMEATQ